MSLDLELASEVNGGLGDSVLYLWDLMLSPGGVCQYYIEFLDTYLGPKNSLLLWENYILIGKW